MKPPVILKKLQSQKQWFKAAQEILQILWQSRDGGTIAKAVAGFSILGNVLNTVFPGESAWNYLHQKGYRETDYPIGGFLCELMMRSGLSMITLPAGLTSEINIWETEKNGIAAVYYGGEYGDGPFLKNADEKFLIETLREVVWNQNGNDLMLSASNKGYFWRGSKKFRLTPMQGYGPYIGKKKPEDFAKRLRKYGSSPRTILLRGPTGIGKSVLARHIAKMMGKKSARTLKVAGSVLKSCGFDEMISLVKFFQPSVLLLDDLELGSEERAEEFLTILEALRAPDCLVIVTMMIPTDSKKKPEMGDYYFSGMRPGRIDEVFTFFLPDAEDRDIILKHYYSEMGIRSIQARTQKAIVKATNGLSGAYLGEVARRIKIHGVKGWKSEVENVRLTAPNPSVKEGEKVGNVKASSGPGSNKVEG